MVEGAVEKGEEEEVGEDGERVEEERLKVVTVLLGYGGGDEGLGGASVLGGGGEVGG